MAKTIRELDNELALEEGLKHQASVGDVKEIRSKLMDKMAREPEVEALFLAGVARRKAKLARAKKKKK